MADKITDTLIKNLSADGGTHVVWDSLVAGFGPRTTRSTARSNSGRPQPSSHQGEGVRRSFHCNSRRKIPRLETRNSGFAMGLFYPLAASGGFTSPVVASAATTGSTRLRDLLS